MVPKKIALGIAATMLSNSFYLSTSYVVKNQNVTAGEVTVFSALLRCFIFGVWSAKVFCQSYPNSTRYGTTAWLGLVSSNFATAVTILLSYVAVTMLPLSDFITFGFTAPVFTLMIVMIFNRSKITVVNISLCIMIVVGNSLVAQPTFLFGQSYLSSSQQPSTYTLGIVLAFTSALITGFCPILQANCKDVPIAYYMLGSGLAKLAIGLLCPLFGLPNYIQDPSRFQQNVGTLTLISAASMLGAMFMQIAIMVSNEPVLVSITRSMEIVMALCVDIIVPNEPINYNDSSIWLKITGSLLVTLCVVGISLSDKIQAKVETLCRREARDGYSVVSNDEEQSLNSNSSEGYGSINDANEATTAQL